MELKLTNVARASLEELRRDYEDFLRQRGLPQWGRTEPRRAELIAARCTTADAVAQWVGKRLEGERNRRGGRDGQSTSSTLSTPSGLAANAALVLIAVANSLLDRQIAALAAAFEKDGGFTERLYRTRTRTRSA
jgi:four helix bundle suffix protein